MSRRQFLRRSLAAVGALACASTSRAAATDADNQSWALLSDTHLAADRSLVFRGVNMTRHFEQVSREVIDLPAPTAGVIISGDCAYNSGELADYSLLSDLLKPMRQAGLPIHLAIGNHDNRERFWEAFAAEKRAGRPLPDRQVSLLRAGHFNWIVLDSLETTLATPGLLGPEQLGWLAKVLDEDPKTPVLLVIHHNPGLNGGNLGLKDTFPLLEVIRPRKQVKAYIYGHTHNWKIETDTSGIHLVNLPPTSYVFTEGKPSGWVHATVEEAMLRLELRCVNPAHKTHGQKVELKFRT